jgi:hypothetical protein
VGEWFTNFTVRLDTVKPIINITQPTGTKASQSVTAQFDVDDTEGISYCYYNVTSSVGGTIIPNTEIENCMIVSSLVFNTGVDATNMKFWMWANDTSNNINMTYSTFSVSTSSGGDSPGGGGGDLVINQLKAIGSNCTLSSECSSSLCDLSEKSKNYGTCQSTLCGNGVKEVGEDYTNCQQDVGLLAQLTRPGNVLKFALISIVGGIGVLAIIPSLKKTRKKPTHRA